MVLSSRDRKASQRRGSSSNDQVAEEELPPEHRRLRFSFQFNNVKDRNRRSGELGGPPFSAGWAAGAAIYGDAGPLSTDPFGLSVDWPTLL